MRARKYPIVLYCSFFEDAGYNHQKECCLSCHGEWNDGWGYPMDRSPMDKKTGKELDYSEKPYYAECCCGLTAWLDELPPQQNRRAFAIALKEWKR